MPQEKSNPEETPDVHKDDFKSSTRIKHSIQIVQFLCEIRFKTFFYSKLTVIVDHCELDKNKKKKNKKKGNSKPDDGIERRVRFLVQFWTRFA